MKILSMPFFLRCLSEMWHVIFDWIRIVYVFCSVGAVGVLVWQLTNLIHAINYIVSLTDGTQVLNGRVKVREKT